MNDPCFAHHDIVSQDCRFVLSGSLVCFAEGYEGLKGQLLFVI
jgi:hypothetical protein